MTRRKRQLRKPEADALDWRAGKRPLGDSNQPGLVKNGLMVKDQHGRLAHPHRIHDTLAALERCGRIGRAQLEAGRRLERVCEQSVKGTLAAASLERSGRTGYGSGPHLSQAAHAAACALEYKARAIAALGGPGAQGAQVTLLVLGQGLTLREAARLCNYLPEGKQGEQAAKWLLLGALDLLALHFGYTKPRKKS